MKHIKELDTSKLINNLVRYIAIAIFTLSLLIIISISLAREQNERHIQVSYNNQIDSSIEHVIKHFVRDYTYRVRRLIETTNLAELVENKDRDGAFNLLNPKYQLMKEESSQFKVMHVHLANGESFLRLHRPEKSGDNIAQKRGMLREIHKNHEALNGYESGIYASVFRILSPIFDKKGIYIGALEIGVNPNFIIEAVREINGFSGLVFIKEDELELHSTPNNIVIDGYRLQTQLDEELKYISSKYDKELLQNKKLIVGDKEYLTHIIMLKNFENKKSVKLVFFQNITRENPFFNTIQLLIYMGILLGLLLLIGLIYFRIKEYQNKVTSLYKEKIKELEEDEEYLANSQKYQKALFDAMPNILIATNGEKIEDSNRAMLEFFGYANLDEFYARHTCICEFFEEEEEIGYVNAKMGDKTWLEYIESNPLEIHKVSMHRDGIKNHFLVNIQKLDYDENNRNLVSFVNITEIEELNDRLELAVNGTNAGIWDWNLESGEIYFSPQWKKQLGYEDNEMEGSYEAWEAHVHPDDKEQIIHDYTANMNRETEFYENTHRLRHKDGSWVWILDRGQTKFDKDGKAIRMVGFHTDITKQKQLEEKLRVTQKQFEHFMEYMPANIIIKDEDRKIIYANKSTKEFFNKEIINKTAEELFPSDVASAVAITESYAIKNGNFEEVIELFDGDGNKHLYRNLTFSIKDGETFKLGIVSIDITSEYIAQHEVAKLKSALDNSPISIMMTDIDGNIEYVNPNYSKVSGYQESELTGMNPRIVKSGETSQEKYKEMWQEISGGNIWRSDVKNIAKDGSEFWEDSTIIPSFDDDGKVDGYIAFKQDITDQIAVRKQLVEQEDMMLAQSRHAAMGEMISMIAHQWRQPISVIAMDANNVLVDIELDSLQTESLKQDVTDIIDQTVHLSQTIDDFRNFFKPNKLKDHVLISDVFEEALLVIAKSLENNNIKLVKDFNTNTVVSIFSRELIQVIINILKNSKEALEENRLEDRKIVNSISESEEDVIIVISDNGGGINEHDIHKIFDPYFSTKGEKNGTGLGLYMSKTIIEKHLFGTINVHNIDEDGERGICFTIKIPKYLEGKENE